MAAKIKEICVWIIMDENEDWVVGGIGEELAEKYDENIGGDASLARRVLKVFIKVPVPHDAILSGEVSDIDTATLKEIV